MFNGVSINEPFFHRLYITQSSITKFLKISINIRKILIMYQISAFAKHKKNVYPQSFKGNNADANY